MPKKTQYRFSMPIHLIGYYYKDIPNECHFVCVETGAFGWGPTPPVALDEMVKTMGGRIAEAVRCGRIDMLSFDNPDTEWLEVYRTNRHPVFEDIKVAVRGTASLSICVNSPNTSVSLDEKIDLIPSIDQEAFQLA